MSMNHVKEAQVAYPILDLLRKRWSPCIFASKPVEKEKLLSLFEALRWAPSSYNEQPWNLIIGIQGEGEAYSQILNCLVDTNIEWAQQAPILGVSVAQLTFSRNGKPNRYAVHDVGLGMGALILQATALGLSVHQMAGFRVEQAKGVLHIPEGYEPVAAFAIGYAGEIDDAPSELRVRDQAVRTRKSQRDFIFEGKMGCPWLA